MAEDKSKQLGDGPYLILGERAVLGSDSFCGRAGRPPEKLNLHHTLHRKHAENIFSKAGN